MHPRKNMKKTQWRRFSIAWMQRMCPFVTILILTLLIRSWSFMPGVCFPAGFSVSVTSSFHPLSPWQQPGGDSIIDTG